jgi:hypothetical protein
MATTDSRPTSTAALVVIVITCFVLLLSGLFLALGGAVSLRRGKYDAGIFFLAFGLFVAAMGGVALAWGIKWVRSSRGFAARQAAHPDQPWFWREDWLARRVADAGGLWAAFFLFLAIVWNAISWPAAALAFAQELIKDKVVLVMMIGFPLIGLGLIWPALYFSRRFLKFGRLWFVFAGLPFRRGDWLEGRIVVERGTHVSAPVIVSVRNRRIRRVPEPGDERETRTEMDLLWESPPVTVDPADFARAGKSVAIPVRLALPAAASATDIRSGTDKIDWVLAMRSEVPGVDMAAEFEVPIF